MSTSRANTSTCTTKKNARRSEVWRTFLEQRARGAILMDSSDGWSFVCVPAVVQPEWHDDLEFLRDLPVREAVEGEPPFVGGWVGFMEYGVLPTRMWWKYCEEVHAFQVTEEGEFFAPEFGVKDFGPLWDFEKYSSKIDQIHELLRAGECYQICLTHPFEGDFSGDPFGLYVRLFQMNPSAMCFYAEQEGWAVVSNSPERLVSLRGGVLRAEPIKGTIGRDEDPAILLQDEKAKAELTMIVDLLRSDLAAVSKVGSVRVPVHRGLMELANVWHTYSVIESELASDRSIVDVLKSVFPGGSVTGCPKIRAMQKIAELEGYERGVYCGSAGYVSLNGHADFNILIRTGVVRGARIVFPSGGGIVMDSTAKSEFDETKKKTSVILRAAGQMN